jgi:hypothetical protein
MSINYDDGPIEFQSDMFGTFHVWREVRALGIYTAKGHVCNVARWGFGETPEEAAKDLLRELSLKETEEHEAKYELRGDLVPPIWVEADQKYFPPTWIEGSGTDLARKMASRPEKFYTAEQPTGTVIRIRGSVQDAAPHGWVYEKTASNTWHTTALEDEYTDHTIQAEANAHGFDLLYTSEVPTK